MLLLVDDVVPVCFINRHVVLCGALVSVGVQVDRELVNGRHLPARVRVTRIIVQDGELLGVEGIQLYLRVVHRVLERHRVADPWLVLLVAIVKMIVLQRDL